MKISDQNASVNIDAYINQVKKNPNTAPEVDPAGHPQKKQDSVDLSQTAREIQAARKLLEEVPEVRTEKVAQLKAQIENGTYVVDNDKLAQKMISESLLNDID